MSQIFAEVVENVKRLSLFEKQELQELLQKHLITDRRQEISENYEVGLEELRDGKITFYSDIEDLMKQLSQD